MQPTGLVGGSWLCVDKRAGWGNGEPGQLGPGHIHPRDAEQVVYLLRIGFLICKRKMKLFLTRYYEAVASLLFILKHKVLY